MLRNRTSRWSAVTALICLALLAAAWFLLVAPRRSHAADLAAQTTAAQSQAVSLQNDIAQLKSEYADLPARRKALAAVSRQLPPDADVPALVRNLQTYAADSGVSLTSVQPGRAVLIGSDTNAAATVTVGSVVSVPIQVNVSGDYFEAALFTKRLQTSLPRAFLITGLTMAKPASGTGITLTLQGQIFVMATAATVGAPTPSATTGSSGGAGGGVSSPSATSTP